MPKPVTKAKARKPYKKRYFRKKRRNVLTKAGDLQYHQYCRLVDDIAVSMDHTTGQFTATSTDGTVANMIQFNNPAVFDNTALNSAQIGASMWFRLDSLTNYTDFTSLYDNYRIDKVQVIFIPMNTGSTNQDSNWYTPTLYTAIDYDDAVVPPTWLALAQKFNCKFRRFEKPVSVILKPRYSTQVFNNGISSGYQIGSKLAFLDCSYPGIEHYGLKFYLRDFPGLNVALPVKIFCFRIQIKYWVTMKTPQ